MIEKAIQVGFTYFIVELKSKKHIKFRNNAALRNLPWIPTWSSHVHGSQNLQKQVSIENNSPSLDKLINIDSSGSKNML